VIHGDIGNGSTWFTTAADAPLGYSQGLWYHVAYVVTPSDYKIYVDGVQRGSGPLPGNALLYDASHLLKIGQSGYDGWNEWFSGKMDEVRVSNTARSAAWLRVQHNNHLNRLSEEYPSSKFYETGVQEAGGADSFTHTITAVPEALLVYVDDIPFVHLDPNKQCWTLCADPEVEAADIAPSAGVAMVNKIVGGGSMSVSFLHALTLICFPSYLIAQDGVLTMSSGYNYSAPLYPAPGQLVTFFVTGILHPVASSSRVPDGIDLPLSLAGVSVGMVCKYRTAA
jgi:hypothetical protein